MKIRKATARYEAWLGSRIKLLQPDLELKHEAMRSARFPFLRATYYRWAQMFPEVCGKLNGAPQVLGVGDLHVENFGTWRDIEGRLIWGINDFDEAWQLPYTHDLVRLAASAVMAIDETHLRLDAREATDALLAGYGESMESGGRAFVLAEHHPPLRTMAVHRLRDPEAFWQKFERFAPVKTVVPASAVRAIQRLLPERNIQCRMVHRIAGLGSLGRERFVAIGQWRGGNVAREAKTLAPSACVWAAGRQGSGRILYQEMLDRAVRCCDPFVKLKGRWIVRRLAPDCSRIELASLPAERDEIRLLHAMGFETANVHLGTAKPKTILQDLKKRQKNWLHEAAHNMAGAVTADWEDWRKGERS
jgi:uncharacterized protein (DUF2252 family)